MKIRDKEIGGDSPCFIVAEAGLAHEGVEENAYLLIDHAVDAGADAVKFQIYNTKDLIERSRDAELYDRFKRKELPYKVFADLKKYAENKGIIWFATPHNQSAFKYLKSLNVDLYKIGSGEREENLIKSILNTKKPVFISTGMREHTDVIDLVRRYGSRKVAFLHCITMYSVIEEYANINFLKTLEMVCDTYKSVVGYSDHLSGTLGVEIAVARGAKIIEKHFILDSTKGNDVKGGLQKKEFSGMVKKIRQIERILGTEYRNYSDSERENELWALKNPKDWKRPL